jgi:hypothetical protein
MMAKKQIKKVKTFKKRRFRITRVLRVLLVLVLMGILYSFGVAVSENVRSKRMIEDFKARGTFEYEETIQYHPGVFQTRKYYRVSRETSYELEDTRSVFYDSSRKFLGQKGDIFATHDSPFANLPLIHLFISYYFGGHAAINNGNNRFIEAVGFPDEDETLLDIILHPGNIPHDLSVTVSRSGSNYWLNPTYRTEFDKEYPYYGTRYRNNFVGLRVKGITDEQLDGVVAYAQDKVDQALYNFLFFLNMEYKYYCTDLVSRAYQSVMVEPSKQRNYSRALNDDRFITSVNDLMLSKQTYMIFYVEFIDEVAHIYYLEDIV